MQTGNLLKLHRNESIIIYALPRAYSPHCWLRSLRGSVIASHSTRTTNHPERGMVTSRDPFWFLGSHLYLRNGWS